MKRLLVLTLLMAVFMLTTVAHAETFNVFIDRNPTTNAALSVLLIEPSLNKHTASSTIPLTLIVTHNTTETPQCNVTLDNTLLAQASPLTTDYAGAHTRSIADGSHSWYVTCADSQTLFQTSAQSFIYDTTSPSITLHTVNNTFKLSDTIKLNYTASDSLSNNLLCNLSLDGTNIKENDLVISSAMNSVPVVSLSNGTHSWYTSCMDTAGNRKQSETRYFDIDIQRDLNLTLNMKEFALGEQGYYILNAPYGADVTLYFSNPRNGTHFITYSNKEFPIVDALNFTQYAGEYIVEAIMNYKGAIQTQKTSYRVKNTLVPVLNINDTRIGKKETVRFKGVSQGGIAPITYSLDLGDGTDTVSPPVTHSFAHSGSYVVSLTAKDAYGNTATVRRTVFVQDRYQVLIYIVDNQTNIPLYNAVVKLHDQEKRTDSEGKVSFFMHPDTYQLLTGYRNYTTVRTHIDLFENFSTIIRLHPLYSLNDTELVAALTNYSENKTKTKTQPAEESKDDTYLDELLTVLGNAKDAMNTLDARELEIAAHLDMIDFLDKAEEDVKRFKRDIDGLKYFAVGEERDNRNKEIQEGIKQLIESTIVQISIRETNRFIKYPTDEELEPFVSSLHSDQFSSMKESELLEHIKKSQEDIIVEAKYRLIDATYLSRNTTKMTFIIYDLLQSNITNDLELRFPSEVIKDHNEIIYYTEPLVVEEGYAIFTPTDSIVIGISGPLAYEDAKKGILIMLPDTTEKSNSLIGYSIFDTTDIAGGSIKFLIILIVILLGAFIVMRFKIHTVVVKTLKNKESKPFVQQIYGKLKRFIPTLDPKIREINALIAETYDLLLTDKVKEAKDNYKKIMLTYNTLDKQLRDPIYEKTSFLYNELLFHQLLDFLNEARGRLETNDTEHAEELYKLVKKNYKELNPNHKERVHSECVSLYKALQEAR